MNILVTGGAGFIGFHTSLCLVTMGHRVTIVDNISDYYDIKLKEARLHHLGFSKKSHQISLQNSTKFSNLFFIKLDICYEKNLTSLFKQQKFDAVCNLAAQTGVRSSLIEPQSYIKSNILGFFNILECCRKFKIKNLCFASSSSVYGLSKKYPYETKNCTDHPISLYGATKKSNEILAHNYSYLYDIKITGLRFFTVYGPWGRPDMAVWKFVESAMNGNTITIFNGGKNKRDFTFIDDVVTGIVKVIEKPAQINKNWNPANPNPSSSQAAYKIYNIGNNQPVAMNDFIATIEQIVGKKLKQKMGETNSCEVASTHADVSELINEMGYKPATNLKDGVSKFFTWYQYYLKTYF